MDPKLRIMTVRLMTRLTQHPDYAAALGIEGDVKKNRSEQSARPK